MRESGLSWWVLTGVGCLGGRLSRTRIMNRVVCVSNRTNKLKEDCVKPLRLTPPSRFCLSSSTYPSGLSFMLCLRRELETLRVEQGYRCLRRERGRNRVILSPDMQVQYADVRPGESSLGGQKKERNGMDKGT